MIVITVKEEYDQFVRECKSYKYNQKRILYYKDKLSEIDYKFHIITIAGEKNALKSAKSYIDYGDFSYKGLIKQLEFIGYTDDEENMVLIIVVQIA